MRLLLAVACLVAFVGCSGWLVREQQSMLGVEIDPGPAYEQLFGRYVELCALSQYRSLEHGEGGVPGHAVMYLKGACKDESAPIPQLRACRTLATSVDDPEHGAGISVNRWLENANWVATPSHRLFFRGDLEQEDAVTRQTLDRTVHAVIEAGVFDGVVFRPDMPGRGSLEEIVGAEFIGTDFALRMARTSYCARVPVTDEMMGEIIDYLNAVNLAYASGRAHYNWSGLSDNCAHLLHNALAAASIWRPRSVRVSKLRQFANLSVPANEVINLAKLGTEGPLTDGREIYRNDEARDALLSLDWLPRRHGAVMTALPPWEPNELFDTHARILLLQGPFRRGAVRTARRIYEDPRFTQLRPNLEYFREIYSALLEKRDKIIAGGVLPLRSVRYLRPTRRYYHYIEEQRAEVERMLAFLDGDAPSAALTGSRESGAGR
jgi:hypothetical protein